MAGPASPDDESEILKSNTAQRTYEGGLLDFQGQSFDVRLHAVSMNLIRNRTIAKITLELPKQEVQPPDSEVVRRPYHVESLGAGRLQRLLDSVIGGINLETNYIANVLWLAGVSRTISLVQLDGTSCYTRLDYSAPGRSRYTIY